MSAESVNGSVRVTWSTTVPPQCVASVRVEFRTSSMGSVVATYTTTNTSQTEFIQTGLQCGTDYYITVTVNSTIETGGHVNVTLMSSQVQVLVDGGNVSHYKCAWGINLIVVYYCTGIPSPVGVRAEVTADNTSIRVSWQWSRQGVPICVDLIRVHYQPQGGSLMNHTVGNSTPTTSAILPNLQCDTNYTIWVEAIGGQISRWSQHSAMFYLPAKGICEHIVTF